MRRIILLAFLLSLFPEAYSQLISGQVLDAKTREPIEFAALHFDGTFVGTIADSTACFELDISKYAARPLSISAVGYHLKTITGLEHAQKLQIFLTPRIFEIKEVTVSTGSLVRKRKDCLRIFRNEFIGRTKNARSCYILNEEDITFNYGSDKDTLRAYASGPLRIRNLALGYEITYHLNCFEYVRASQSVIYNGSIIFNQDLALYKRNQKKYLRRRGYAFSGSTKHFFRLLWENSLHESRFTIRDYATEKHVSCKQVVSQDSLKRKYLSHPGDLAISYESYFNFISYLHFLGEKVYFEQDGFFDPTAILWTGTMALQRIADFLPYDYLPPE